MRRELLKYIVVSSLVFGGALVANEVNNTTKNIPLQEEKQEMSTHAFPIASEIAGSNLEQQRDKYLANKGKHLGFTQKGSYLGWGSATIEVSPQSVDFGQQRIMAFERAFIKAKSDFVQTKQQQVATSVVSEVFHNDGQKEEVQLQDGKLLGIGKKLLALTEAKLDNALQEMGVDPKMIQNSDITKKRELAKDSIEKEVIVRAAQNVSGIRILATFEDLKGVGVLIVQSPEYATLANDMVQKKLVAIPSNESPTQSISNLINEKFANVNALIPQYGVRMMADKAGNRVLVSFGQWSPKVTKNDTSMAINTAVQAAKKLAYDQALSYMTMFMNTTLALENRTKLRSSNEILELTKNSGIEKKESSNVGAIVDNFIKENSNVNIEGVSTVKTWTTNHPDTGHLIVGSVLVWSPLTQEFARQDPKEDIEKTDASKPSEPAPTTNKVYKSVDFGDDDF